jgi:hypothetical protein
LQLDEATCVLEDARVITHVTYVLESGTKEDFLFCKSTDGRDASLEILDMINGFSEENEINWDNCIGL